MSIARFAPSPSQFCRFALTIGLLASGVVVADRASAQGTYAQRMACTGDAFRLCSEYIPDATAVRACMIAKKPQLSDGCRATFKPAANRQADAM